MNFGWREDWIAIRLVLVTVAVLVWQAGVALGWW